MAYIIKIEDKEFKGEIKKVGNAFSILVNGKELQAEVVNMDKERLTIIIENKPYQIFFDDENQLTINGESYSFEIMDEQMAGILKTSAETAHKKEITITAPMPGLVIEVEVKEGDSVKKGQGLVIVEAMKMQNEMKSPRDGVVKKIMVEKGKAVNSKDPLVVIE